MVACFSKALSCGSFHHKNNFLGFPRTCPGACEPLGSLSPSIQDPSPCDKDMSRCEEICISGRNWQPHCLPQVTQGIPEKLLPGCLEAAKHQHFSFVFLCRYCNSSVDQQCCTTPFVSETAFLKVGISNLHKYSSAVAEVIYSNASSMAHKHYYHIVIKRKSLVSCRATMCSISSSLAFHSYVSVLLSMYIYVHVFLILAPQVSETVVTVLPKISCK